MKKRIITGATLLVFMAIAITAMVLGFVQTNNKPELAVPYDITFTTSQGQKIVSNINSTETETELFNKIHDAYNDMFNISLLTGIFTGNIKNYQVNERTNVSELSGNKVKFSYLENQTLKVDGEKYYSKYDKSKVFEYKTVEFIISEDDAYSEIIISVYLKDTTSSGKSFYAEIVTMANTSKIYNVIQDFYK